MFAPTWFISGLSRFSSTWTNPLVISLAAAYLRLWLLSSGFFTLAFIISRWFRVTFTFAWHPAFREDAAGSFFLPPATHFHITRRCCQVLVIGVENKNHSVSHLIGLDRCKWFHAASAVCTGPKQRRRPTAGIGGNPRSCHSAVFAVLLIFRLHKSQVGKVLLPLTRQTANSLTAYYIELRVPGLSRKSMGSSAEPHFKIKHQQTNTLKSNSFWNWNRGLLMPQIQHSILSTSSCISGKANTK